MRGGWRTTAGTAIAVAAIASGCGDDSEPPATTSPSGGGGGSGGSANRPATGSGEGGVELTEIGNFSDPVHVADADDGSGDLYVVEQCGTIQRLPGGEGSPEPFLDLSEMVTCGGEQGLLSVAFAPDYERSRRLYVYFTDLDQSQRIVEYSRSAAEPVADPDSARELLAMDDFASNHNGGLLLFGPDGELYAGTGDGGGGGDPERTAQDPRSPLGKLLRVDLDGGEPEVAALGLRNPWRYSFDRETGDLWIGDVGQDEFEEIDSLAAADLRGTPNFGWSAFEANEPYNPDQEAPGAIAPTHEYGTGDAGRCSVTGGYVVRDPELESLYGRYLYGDFCDGVLRSFTAEAGDDRASDDRELGLEVPALSSFGEDAAGHLYAVSLEGPVYRLVAAG